MLRAVRCHSTPLGRSSMRSQSRTFQNTIWGALESERYTALGASTIRSAASTNTMRAPSVPALATRSRRPRRPPETAHRSAAHVAQPALPAMTSENGGTACRGQRRRRRSDPPAHRRAARRPSRGTYRRASSTRPRSHRSCWVRAARCWWASRLRRRPRARRLHLHAVESSSSCSSVSSVRCSVPAAPGDTSAANTIPLPYSPADRRAGAAERAQVVAGGEGGGPERDRRFEPRVANGVVAPGWRGRRRHRASTAERKSRFDRRVSINEDDPSWPRLLPHRPSAIQARCPCRPRRDRTSRAPRHRGGARRRRLSSVQLSATTWTS